MTERLSLLCLALATKVWTAMSPSRLDIAFPVHVYMNSILAIEYTSLFPGANSNGPSREDVIERLLSNVESPANTNRLQTCQNMRILAKYPMAYLSALEGGRGASRQSACVSTQEVRTRTCAGDSCTRLHSTPPPPSAEPLSDPASALSYAIVIAFPDHNQNYRKR